MSSSPRLRSRSRVGAFGRAAPIYGRGLFATIILCTSLMAYPAAAALVGHYGFTQNVLDVSGNESHGAIPGIDFVSDRSGAPTEAFYFNGYDTRVQLPGQMIGSRVTMSIAFWTRTTDTGSVKHWISAAGSSSTNEFLIRHDNGRITIWDRGVQHYFTNPRINDGAWHHVAVTRASSRMDLYVDGVLASTWYSYFHTLSLYPSGLWLGGDQDCLGGCWDPNQQFEGAMDDLRFYGGTLTAADVAELSTTTNPTGITAPLLGWYGFEGSAADLSGNGFDGILPTNLTYAADRLGTDGGALYFNSYPGLVELPASMLDGLLDVTISFWVQTTGTGYYKNIVSAASTTQDNEWLIAHLNGRIAMIDQGGPTHEFTNPAINDGLWHQIVLARDGAGLELYVDGTFADSWSKSVSNLVVSDGGLWLGNDQDWLGGGWDPNQQYLGGLDDLRFYDTKLTAAEIQDLYDSEAPFGSANPLLVHFDATDLTLADGQVLTTWGQQSAVGTPTFRAEQTPGGGPAVEFNGSGDRFANDLILPASSGGDWIVAAVVHPNSIGAYHNLVDDDAQNRPMLWIDPAFRYELNFSGGTGARVAGTGPLGWDIVIADSRHNQLYVNSATPNATGRAPISFNAHEAFDFFHRDGGQTYSGLVAELRLYNDAAGFGGDFAALYGELYDKWMEPPVVTLTGFVDSECDGPLANVTVNVLHPAGTYTTVTDGSGHYTLELPRDVAMGSVTVELPDGYDHGLPEDGIVECNFAADLTANFTLSCVYVTVSGTVLSGCAGPLLVTVDLEHLGEYYSARTDENGLFSFEGLRWTTTEGEVSIVTPLGFACTDPVDAHTAVSFTEDRSVPFTLQCLDATGQARGMGYWKHQARSYLDHKGKPQETFDDMAVNFPQAIFQHFHENELNSIQVAGVSCLFTEAGPGPIDLPTIENTLTVNKGGTMADRAKQHYLSLLLNIASGKLMTWTLVSDDGFTASQALQDVADLINTGGLSDQARAKDIAEAINEGTMVAAGMIRDLWGNIAYKQQPTPSAPARFELMQNTPNPFNPSTVIYFTLAQAGEYRLAIYNAAGRLVRGYRAFGQPGPNSVQWDGRSPSGARVASGVYYYHLKAGALQQTRKMVLAQ